MDKATRPDGVIPDRDIDCRDVAEGKIHVGHAAESAMPRSDVSVSPDARLEDVISTMEEHQIRRVLVVDGGGCCTGIIAQADIASAGPSRQAAELVREVSRQEAR